MKNSVFVYGTLRKNEENHRLLSHAKHIAAQAWTKGKLFDTGFGYPAMSLNSEEWTYGELYEVDEDTLSQLDQLEGFHVNQQSNLYDRITQQVLTDQGPYQAYVYVAGALLSDLEKEINSGDWRVYRILQHRNDIAYFAYGSCMDDERFKLAGVDHYFKNVLGKGVLPDYRIGFTRHSHDGGRADIIEAAGHTVEGKVYHIPRAALHYLFRREGVISRCYRPTVIDIIINGVLYNDVLTFTVVDKREEIAPPIHYENEIKRGGQDFLSQSYAFQLNVLIETLRQQQVK
jgi:gamma-glutamylcyclotransferase (GGCT)/AIG2-like uncharacterized protein YtfP/cation transport regulator ChaC